VGQSPKKIQREIAERPQKHQREYQDQAWYAELPPQHDELGPDVLPGRGDVE